MTDSRRIRKRLARHVVYPLKDAAVGRDVLGLLAELRSSEALPSEQLRELQARRLRDLLERAYERVPYYHSLFRDCGLHPREIRDVDDLARLPVMTRTVIRARRDELVAREPGRGYVQTVYTSGSSGEPLAFRCDASAMSHHLANRLRGRAWHGIDVGDSELLVWHDPGAYAGRAVATRAFWAANAVKDRLLGVHAVDATDLSEQTLAAWERRLRRIRPAVVYGYASSIYLFARFLRDHAVRCGDLPIKAVILTAEKILPTQKRLIAEVFDTAVVEEYGTAECGVIAFECPRGRLHASDESVVLEVCEPGPDGTGPLLVTTLANRAMPLVRYEIGDLASRSEEPCPCGRGLGVVREVAGRTTDFLVDSRREHVHPFRLMHFLQRFPTIVRYRIVQRSIGAVDLILQASSALDERDSALILSAFREALGEETNLHIRYTSSIPSGPRGKHQFLVNLVDEGGAGPWTPRDEQ